ncbi:polyamine aminopropyltransferase [Desulfurella sp.]|uniref:polyamine aminopropyltransferase n=1 Tax=Desulfurella sp. TaxID=1962857 RepID=UPI003D0ABA19
MDPEMWFTEKYKDNAGLTFKIKEILVTKESSYQRLDIIDTYSYGKVMLLDGLVMLTQKDEFVYHEMITAPAIMSLKNTRKALIIGGGDGGTARELTKYNFEKITEVEIDEVVVENSKKFLDFTACGYNDKRVEVILGDGIEFVKNTKEKFDLVIIDSTDPFGAAEGLFSGEFYSNVYNILHEDGIVVAQAENPYYNPDWFLKSRKNMQKAFGVDTLNYCAFIPTYPSGMWLFSIGYKNINLHDYFNEELYEKNANSYKYYNNQIHKACFALPQFVLKLIK